jgi:hypothetical protein
MLVTMSDKELSRINVIQSVVENACAVVMLLISLL